MNKSFDYSTADKLGRNGDECDGRASAATPSGSVVRQTHAHANSMPGLRGPSVSCSGWTGVHVRNVPPEPQGCSMSDFPPVSVRLIT